MKKLLLWLVFGVLGLSAVAYGVDYVMSEGRVPRGVTVGGVDIGGMTPAQAEQRLRIDLGEDVRQPVTVNAGAMSSVLLPQQAGLQVDWAATVEQAGQQPLNPITRVRSFFEQRVVPIVSRIDDASFNRALSRVERELTRNPIDAQLSVGPDGKAQVIPDQPGQTVTRDVLRTEVAELWLNTTHTVPVPANVTDARLRADDAKAMVDTIITPAASGPLRFHGRDGVVGEIHPPDLGRVLTFGPDEKDPGRFAPQWHPEAAQEILAGQLGSTEKEFRNATFIGFGGDLTVVPHQDGVSIKWDDTLGDLQAKYLDTAHRDHEVKYEDKPATYTTDMAQRARFDDVMGEFTTGGFSDASGVNIRRVAQMVNGAIVLPGETFSLNGFTGPRGTEQGFVESGIIKDGRADKAVGGGISQFATTLYNASYFAGMEDVTHTPHSYYISRYPAGREATVYEGAIDLQFRNPFDTPVRIITSADANSVTVKMYGVKHVTVESIPGPRTARTQPETRRISGPDCTPSTGAPGFTTTDTRVVRDLGGRELSRTTTRTVYDPAPTIVCAG